MKAEKVESLFNNMEWKKNEKKDHVKQINLKN